MNSLQTLNTVITMSSREIAELTGKSHAHVMRDIRKMLESLGLEPLDFSGYYLDVQNKERLCFNLSTQLIFTLISSYDTKARFFIFEKLKDINLNEVLSMFDAEELDVDQFVYVAREEVSGRYKVGISKDPVNRVKQLNIGNPERLVLMAAYQANLKGRLSETNAHKVLSKWNLRSEWFSSNADVSLIQTVI